MATSESKNIGEKTHIMDDKDALAISELIDLLNMSEDEKDAVFHGDTDVPEDWEGDVTDEEIEKLLEDDTSEGAQD